jgi:hypothetical protein
MAKWKTKLTVHYIKDDEMKYNKWMLYRKFYLVNWCL